MVRFRCLNQHFPVTVCGLIEWRNFEGILTVTVMHNEGYMIQHGINVRIIVRFEIKPQFVAELNGDDER